MEAAQVSISRWVDKITMEHLHDGRLLGHKKEKKILPFRTVWMDLENIMLSETSQTKTNTIWFHACVQSNEQTELKRKPETDS